MSTPREGQQQKQHRSQSFDSADTDGEFSKSSEVYLARIQQETNRVRKKRRDRSRDSNSSFGNSSSDSGEFFGSSLDNDHHHEGTAAAAVAEKLVQRTKGKPVNELSLVNQSFDSVLSGSPNTTKAAATANHNNHNASSPLGLGWNEILSSSERSNRSLQSDEEANITLKSVDSRSSASIIYSQIDEEEDVDNDNDHQASIELQLEATTEEPFVVPLNTNESKGSLQNFFSNSSSSFSNLLSGLVASSPKQHTNMSESNLVSATPADAAETEAFQKSLIDEVLGKDAGDKVSMEKIVMIIWQFRDDQEVLKFMTRFVSKFAGSRDVFDGIEFYLPQLAHMMIHLETEWDDAILERFCLVIAQQSTHFALQLNWILAGAIEDYQPELPDGTPNPTYNPVYYFRCVKLLTNIERCVVYRRPRSRELQRLYEKGNITKAEMHSLEQADRRFTAMQITGRDNGNEDDEIFGGNLKYKRAVRTSMFKFKRWKTRYFAIEERMLNCYNTKGGKLVRSMPLEGATVRELGAKGKYPNMIGVANRSYEFRMRATSPEDRKKWIKMLTAEATTGRVFGHTERSLFLENNLDAQRVIDELTPSQRERYMFYRNEREFVRKLTDIAEDLRFLEPDQRKAAAPGMLADLEIPPHAYSPLMSSTDIFRRLHSTLSKDTRVFNTKARCPTVMFFLGVRGELEYKGERHANMDIAEYIHLKFDANQDNADWKNSDISTKVDEDGQEVIEVKLDVDKHLSSDSKETLVVKKTMDAMVETKVSTIDEGDETSTKDEGGGPPATQRTSLFTTPAKQRDSSQSLVWSGSLTETPATERKVKGQQQPQHTSPTRANRHLRKFLRESMVSVPHKLKLHLDKKGTRMSSSRSNSKNSVDSSQNSLGGKNIPIASGRTSSFHGIGEDVYIGKSSVIVKSNIIKGKSRAGDIDEASMNRAKKVICGGQSWAEKSFQMLENVKNKPTDEKVQLEIVSLLSKSNDDLRQEVFVMQMIHYYKSVFIAAGIPLWLKTYKILSTGSTTGMLEFMVDSTSLDGLKKSEHYPQEGGLRRYYEETYGGPDSKSFKAAQRNFVQSLAAYSVVCYLLGLKDRHNGNIMIDMRGHLIHIDFGFAMGMNVAHEFTMERAPFKLTEEYVEVMGGSEGEAYKEFQRLFVEGMVEARSKCQIALGLVEIMMYKSNYPCFSGTRYGGGQALRGFRERLMLDVPDNKVEAKARALIEKARNHWGTRAYDWFQQWSNGYAI